MKNLLQLDGPALFNRVALTAVFCLSFFGYFAPDLSVFVQTLPWLLFACLVYVRVGWSSSLLAAVGSLLSLDGLVLTFGLGVFITGSSYCSFSDVSFQFSLFVFVCLVIARLYVAVVSLKEVIESFFWSGVICVGAFCGLAFDSLVRAGSHLERLAAFSFHPNLLASIMAAYCVVMVWKIATGDWIHRILAVPVCLTALTIIFLASARSAIIGLVAAGCVAGLLGFRKMNVRRRYELMFRAATAVILAGVLVGVVQRSSSVSTAYEVVDTMLAVSNAERGVGSGFSGRIDKWRTTLDALADGSWVVGHGIRSSDSMEQLIDNSYIVLLYEVGLLPTALIAGRLVLLGFRSSREYFRKPANGVDGFALCLCAMIVLQLVSGIFQRTLFAVGNPASLLTFLIFLTPSAVFESSNRDSFSPGR